MYDFCVERLPENKVVDLKYADDVNLLDDSSQALKNWLDRLGIEVSLYGMCFTSLNTKALLHDWQEPVPSLVFGNR